MSDSIDFWRIPVEKIPSGWHLCSIEFSVGRCKATIGNNTTGIRVQSSGHHRHPHGAVQAAVAMVSP